MRIWMRSCCRNVTARWGVLRQRLAQMLRIYKAGDVVSRALCVCWNWTSIPWSLLLYFLRSSTNSFARSKFNRLFISWLFFIVCSIAFCILSRSFLSGTSAFWKLNLVKVWLLVSKGIENFRVLISTLTLLQCEINKKVRCVKSNPQFPSVFYYQTIIHRNRRKPKITTKKKGETSPQTIIQNHQKPFFWYMPVI